jgi:hypothetical protein
MSKPITPERLIHALDSVTARSNNSIKKEKTMLDKIAPIQNFSPSNHQGDRLEAFTIIGGGMDSESVGRCRAGVWHLKAEWEGAEVWPKLMGKGYCRALEEAYGVLQDD